MGKLWEYSCWGIFAAWGFFAPLHAMFTVMLVFVGIDFVTGVWASYARAKRSGRPWAFRSDKAWETVFKFVYAAGAVILMWLMDTYPLSFVNLHLAQIVTGVVCGVEFWSFLENGADIAPNATVFKILRKIMAKEIKEHAGIDVEETMKTRIYKRRKVVKNVK